jgi:hypothetical protein
LIFSGEEKWQKGIQEGLLMSCRDNLTHDTHIVTSRLWRSDHGSSPLTIYQGNQPQREQTHVFSSLTFTRALRKNVKKRLQKLNIDIPNVDMLNGGDFTHQFYFNQYVSEVCLSIAPCDFILCMEPVSAILSSLNHMELPKTTKTGKTATPFKGDKSVAPSLNTCNLPLLYADVSNVRIFIPGEETESKHKKEKISTTIENDMLLFQVSYQISINYSLVNFI